MTLFTGNHPSKRDAKGRVSIPAQFRSTLKKKSHAGEAAPVAAMYLRPSHQHACIEGWTELGFEALGERMTQGYPEFSQEYDDIVTAFCGNATRLETDTEGRIMLPPNLIEHGGLKHDLIFIGTRNTFQIWEAAIGGQRLLQAQANLKASGLTLRPPVTA